VSRVRHIIRELTESDIEGPDIWDLICVQEAKSINRKRLVKIYNKLYGQATNLLKKHSPCAIDTSADQATCLAIRQQNRAGIGSGVVKPDTLCCAGCPYHTSLGCTAEKPLACKTWLCYYAAKQNPEMAKRLCDFEHRARIAGLWHPRGDMKSSISRALDWWKRYRREERKKKKQVKISEEEWIMIEEMFDLPPEDPDRFEIWLERVGNWLEDADEQQR